MKYRLYNPDDSPTTLVYDTLFKANYMIFILGTYGVGLSFKEEPEPDIKKDESYWEQTNEKS